MKYFDFHTHTYPDDSEDITAIISCVAPDPLNKCREGTLLSYGIHPWYINGQNEDQLIAQVKEAGHYSKVVAIGEVGLDKVKGPAMGIQTKLFCRQIEISEMVKKPLIIHSVKANNEILALRKNWSPQQTWIIHGFAGSKQEMEQFVEAGFYLSFGPKILYPGHKVAEALNEIPEDRLLLETDHTNKSILRVYDKAAEIRGVTIEKIAETVEKNFKSLISTF
jgi:TatD DNase family protein